MSEVPFIGRTPIYVGTLFAFVILQFPVIYASNASMLLAFRFITGLVGIPYSRLEVQPLPTSTSLENRPMVSASGAYRQSLDQHWDLSLEVSRQRVRGGSGRFGS